MAKNIHVPVLSGKTNLYSFGWSLSDDIDTVTNWQEGNNQFLDLDDGLYFVFAKPINGQEDDWLRIVIQVGDDDCQLELDGFYDITPACKLVINGFFDITSAAVYDFPAITGYNIEAEQLTCEILANPHSNIAEALARAQHHYAIKAETKMAGTIFSEAGEVSKDGGATWTALTELGFDSIGRRFAGYKLPYTTPVNPLLRTSSVCQSYSDSRNTEYFTANMGYKVAMSPADSPSPGNFDLTGILIANHLDSRQDSQGLADIYVIWLAGHGQSYSVRINEGAWKGGVEKNIVPSVNSQPVTSVNIPVAEFSIQTAYPKDFLLDISKDGGTTYDRYVVRRWSLGGHYSTVCSITRMRDNKVYVCTTNGDVDVPSYLKIGGTTYNNMAAIKCCWDIGVKTADATATFGFTDSSTDWADFQLLIDDWQ